MIDRSTLQKTLRQLSAFDPHGTPFVGLQMKGELPLFHRSSQNGIMHSIGFDLRYQTSVISLSHAQDCIRAIQDERVKIHRDQAGIIHFQSAQSSFSDDICVHTLRENQPWTIHHQSGSAVRQVSPTQFEGVSVGHFSLAMPPVLRGGALMLVTDHGIVFRRGLTDVPGVPSPREPFLKSLSSKPKGIAVTDRGYWVAQTDDMQVVVAGHSQGEATFRTYDTGATVQASINAPRLLHALNASSSLSGPESRTRIHPVMGVSTQDAFGNIAKFSLGELPPFTPLAVPDKTVRTILSALEQDKAEEIQISLAPGGIRRISRGLWSVDFLNRE